ncbi:MAG: prolyl oligopeptidase family serine peptidase [Bacteroidales bacterium]|nr:prolyl oligopeptidase family serine peptidase [Bacteroidales bacterium]
MLYMPDSYYLFRKSIVLFLILIDCVFLNGQSVSNNRSVSDTSWRKIAPFFQSPVEFRDQYGDYRSPLKFYDGNTVKTRKDWERRRKEILGRWNEMMGEWPPLIKDQKPEILESTQNEGFVLYRIRFFWLPDQKTDAYLLIPDKKGKKPTVITVYYEPETAIGIGDSKYRDFAVQLAKRGFVSLSIGTAATTKSKTYSLYYPDIQNSVIQPLSALACAAANSWFLLAGNPEVDSERIGIIGHSYGGKWAMFASCLFDKFACAVWSDPGIVFDDARPNVNYWEPWYLGYYPPPWNNTWRKSGNVSEAKGLYPKLIAGGYNLHELHALMAPRPFLVSGGSEDTEQRWIVLNHAIAVNRLLGYENRVAMTNRPDHSPTAESNEHAYLFFEHFLK